MYGSSERKAPRVWRPAKRQEAVMRSGAHTPEELEMLFEDTLVLRDEQELAGLFEDGALLFADDGRLAYGVEESTRLALATWKGEQSYVADPKQIMLARNIALIVAERGVNVARRCSNGIWRYAIIHLPFDDTNGRSRP
jgi:hypothetical protein